VKSCSALVSKLLNILMVLALSSMVVLVFGNVVMRYAFNSGITWSEEIARFAFIWLIFLGAIGAMKDNQHLGVDMLIQRLPKNWRKLVFAIGNVGMLYVLYLVLDGSWNMTMRTLNSASPATGIPFAYLHGMVVVMSIGMAIILIVQLYRAFFEEGAIYELTRKLESEEELKSEKAAS
jgi:TRAP-type C4-dicarboxylate transport system permease small subunit